jgi:hypothetical protein
VNALLEVMLEARRLTALPVNDFSWSSFIDRDAALFEIDAHIANLRAGETNAGVMSILFLPTGPLQELALSSGWGDEFGALADRFDAASAAAAGIAIHRCGVCGNEAGRLTIVEGELRRVTFTGTLTQPATHAVRDALGHARALHALDFELAPFYCPPCDRVYCGEHWRRFDVFDDDGFHDSIRGTCPTGHERMLED